MAQSGRFEATRFARRHRAPLVLLALVALSLGLVGAYKAMEAPVEHREMRYTNRWVERAAFTYEVPVSREAPGFEAGSVLPMDEPGYFSTVSPAFTLAFAWEIPEPEDARAIAFGDLRLRVVATSPSAGTVWTYEESLANGTTPSEGSSALDLAGSVDVERVSALAASALQKAAARDAALRWDVVATVKFAAGLPFGHVSESSTYLFPIRFDAPLYVLPAAEDVSFQAEHGEPVVFTTVSRAGASALLASPAPVLLTLAGLVGLGALARIGSEEAAIVALALPEAARHPDRIAIVRGPLPRPEATQRIQEIANLNDLEEIAARAQTRVVFDAARRLFLVYAPDVVYQYARRGPTILRGASPMRISTPAAGLRPARARD